MLVKASVVNIWLPYLRTGSGTDVYTKALARVLVSAGHNAVCTPFSGRWQYVPWPLRFVPAPPGTEIILANSWNGFAFRRQACKLVIVEHHCVLDPAYAPYRGRLQGLFHECLVRGFEKASLKRADTLVAVSAYTAASIRTAVGAAQVTVILNGVDTDFFFPTPKALRAGGDRAVRLLFVGNLIRRKGADMLPRIMAQLGPGFELRYTLGLRSTDPFSGVANMRSLGRLAPEELRDAYREADILLFPTRFEGFGYAAAEAMACGTPVVASATSSLPEIIEDGVTGRLCPVNDCEAFASAVRELAGDSDQLHAMGRKARAAAVTKFGLDRWTREYVAAFRALTQQESSAYRPTVV